ncbi:amidohydrolase family protein [bacterium]|nr:amidohydrolase family protein [bacterium]
MIDLILTDGRIHTLSADHPIAEAIAISNGRIVAVGRNEDVAHLGLAGTRRESLGGRVVIPGLVDAHIHWEWTAMNQSRVILHDLPSMQACLDAVAAMARKLPEGQWIQGFGWAQGPWTDTGGAFPTKADLDRAAPNHPVYLSARSGHASWCNSLALRMAGIDRHTPNPPGGAISHDAHGEPDGILFEDASDLVSEIVPAATEREVADHMRQAQELAWQVGLTGLHDFDRPRAFRALQMLHEEGTLGLRVLKQINVPYIGAAQELGVRYGFGNEWLRLGALKIFADGAIGSLTAQMIDPYEGQPDNRGIIVTPKDQMAEMVLEATRRGIPSTIHAIGDEAVRHVLDVFELARAEEARLGIPRVARRHRIEHVQVIHPDDVHRLAALNIVGSFQPIHATSDYPVADRYWGDRCALAYNPRRQLDLGTVVVFGSDSPVETFDPFPGIRAAVTRRRDDGTPGPQGWYPEARVTLDEALHAYTVAPAWVAGQEHEQGRLAAGFLADLLVLDRDPWSLGDPMELRLVRPVATMVGGRWRWRTV